MSEDYYNYNENENVSGENIDLSKDEIYDFVLEREKIREIEKSGYKNINKHSQEWKIEGFDNIKSYFSMKNLIIIIILIIVIYFIYKNFYSKNKSESSGGNKVAKLV